MKKQHVLPVILTLVIMTIATTRLASIIDVSAQSGDTEQVKEYLIQAMQALDDGNNTLALEQVDLASDVLGNMTGGVDVGEEDNEGTDEERAGEDTNEAGDDDANDEEDSESN